MEKTAEAPAIKDALDADMLDKILDEIANYSIDLEEDPTHPTLGNAYLQKVLALCRTYSNRVQYYMQKVKRYENRLRSEVKIRELSLDLKTKDLLADDAIVRKQPSIEDRKAVASAMLRDDHLELADLQSKVHDVEDTYKIIKSKHVELQKTANDIKTQRMLVKDDMLARLGGMEGYVKPQTFPDKSFPNSLPPPVAARIEMPDILAGVKTQPLPEPTVDDDLKDLMERFSKKPAGSNKVMPYPVEDPLSRKEPEVSPGSFADVVNERTKSLTGTKCSECGSPQFSTPSGVTCENGHGGAEPKDPVGLSYEDLISLDVLQRWGFHAISTLGSHVPTRENGSPRSYPFLASKRVRAWRN